MIVVKTHLHLLVATYTEGMYPSVCVEATEKLGKSVSQFLSSYPKVRESSDCKRQRPNSNQLGQKEGIDWKDTRVPYITAHWKDGVQLSHRENGFQELGHC